KEAVSHQTAGGVQDEDLERDFTKAETVRAGFFGQCTDQGIDQLDVVVVQALEVGQQYRVGGQVFKLLDFLEANGPAEFIVAGYATLAVTQDVDGGHIDVANQRHGQVPEELRVVFQYQRTRVGDAEGIPQAVCAHIVQDILGVA